MNTVWIVLTQYGEDGVDIEAVFGSKAEAELFILYGVEKKSDHFDVWAEEWKVGTYSVSGIPCS